MEDSCNSAPVGLETTRKTVLKGAAGRGALGTLLAAGGELRHEQESHARSHFELEDCLVRTTVTVKALFDKAAQTYDRARRQLVPCF